MGAFPLSGMEIARLPVGDPVAGALLAAALADLAERYGGAGDETPMDGAQFDPPAGAFLVAWLGGVPAGCGGWRTLAADPDVAEIKRMYTRPDQRGHGVASAVLRALEESARAAGRKRMALETGYRQPEAIALYQKLGYEIIPNYGHYADHPLCVSFGLAL